MNNIQSFIDNNSIQPAEPEEPELDEDISNLFNNEEEDY